MECDIPYQFLLNQLEVGHQRFMLLELLTIWYGLVRSPTNAKWTLRTTSGSNDVVMYLGSSQLLLSFYFTYNLIRQPLS